MEIVPTIPMNPIMIEDGLIDGISTHLLDIGEGIGHVYLNPFFIYCMAFQIPRQTLLKYRYMDRYIFIDRYKAISIKMMMLRGERGR